MSQQERELFERRYRECNTEFLLEIRHKGNLTLAASEALGMVLEERGISAELASIYEIHGVPEGVAEPGPLETEEQRAARIRRSGRAMVFVGAVLFGLGLLFQLGTFALASSRRDGGPYLIPTGLYVLGLGIAFKGMTRLGAT